MLVPGDALTPSDDSWAQFRAGSASPAARAILGLAVPTGTYESWEKRQLQSKSPLLSQGVLSDRRVCKQEERE